MTYPKVADRPTFTVAGDSPHLPMVRDHLIRSGWVLVPWHGDQATLSVIGADLDCKTTHMPLAQIEMQLMNVGEVLLLSSPMLTIPDANFQKFNTPARATYLYAAAAEHMFEQNTPCTIVRPVNVFGPNCPSFITDAIRDARNNLSLQAPALRSGKNTFIYEKDFLDAIDFIIKSCPGATYDISGEEMSYQNVLRTIWKFIHRPTSEPEYCLYEDHSAEYMADITALDSLGWTPKTSIRSAIFDMII